MEKKILFPIIAVLGILSISIIFSQNVFAQTTYDVDVFGTGNASDDNCNTIVQSGSVIFLGCYASASTTLRINAVTGNSTIATTTLASSQGSKFYLSGSNEIVLLDALNNSMKKYQLSGSTITNTATTNLTGCSEEKRYLSQATSTQLVISCTSGEQRLFNMNTMSVDATWSTTIQGDCANPNQVFMQAGSITKGVVSCDNTEVYLFTVSGGTITFTDSLTGWNSGDGRHLISGNSLYRWVDSGSSLQVASINTSTWVFTSGLTDFPTQTDVSDMIVQFGYSLSMDGTSENILYYLTNANQPSPAEANITSPSFDFGTSWDFGELRASSDNLSLLVASSVANAGRYYIISNIVINGFPVEDSGDDPPSTGGIDCNLPANANLLICRLLEDTGGEPIVLLPRVGILITTNINNILCSILPIDCDANPDIATNGVGYLYTIVVFGIMIAIFFVATNGQLNKIPTFIWMISSIALLGALVAINFLDPTFLVIGIIVIVALAAMQIRNSITSGFDFARGDF